MKWKYEIKSGSVLREAIDNGDIVSTVECLIQCYAELLKKLSAADKDWLSSDIEDDIMFLQESNFTDDDAEEVDCYLERFYDLCDDVKAFVAL